MFHHLYMVKGAGGKGAIGQGINDTTPYIMYVRGKEQGLARHSP